MRVATMPSRKNNKQGFSEMTTNYETDLKAPGAQTDFVPELSSPCFSILRLKQDNQPELPLDKRPSCFSLKKLERDIA